MLILLIFMQNLRIKLLYVLGVIFMRKFYKTPYLQVIPIFNLGFSIDVISIWLGIISGNNRNCFFDILKVGSDGSVKLGPFFS